MDKKVTAEEGRGKSIYRIWSYPNYVLFALGACGNHITIWAQRVAIGWLAWELTGSTVWLGAVAAADLAPMLVLATIAGAVADRSNALKMVRIFQGLFVLQAGVLAALTFTGLITIELLFLLSLMMGMTHPFWLASRQIVMPATVPREHVGTVVAVDSASFQTARFIGPAVAGIFIPVTGVGGIFLAHVIGSLVFLTSLLLLNVKLPERRATGDRRIMSDIADGFRYVRGHGGILPMLVLMAAASVFLRPIQDMLPGFADDVYSRGAQGLAWLTSAMGVGAMVSATRIAVSGRIEGLTRAALAGGAGVVLATVGLAATDMFWFGVAACVLFGYTFNTVSTSIQAVIHSTVADDMRGRVVSFYMLVFRGMPAIGALAVGVMAEFLGLRVTAAVSALMCLVVWAAIAVRYREIEQANEAGADEGDDETTEPGVAQNATSGSPRLLGRLMGSGGKDGRRVPISELAIVRVWQHRNYAFYMGGMTPNLVSIWMMRVGVGWLAWKLTESPTWLGIIAAADLAPMLILGLFAGAVTDRMDPLLQAKQMQWLQLLHAVLLFGLTALGWMTIELLFVLCLFLGITHPFSSTARHAIVPATVPKEMFATAVATDSALFNASRFIGPAFAALIIPFAGVSGTFAVHVVGCVVFLAAMYFIDLPERERHGHGKGGLMGDVRESIGYVMAHPGIWPLFLALTAVSAFLRPIQDMLPGFSDDVFGSGATGLALLTSGMGVGAMVSALWVAAYGRVAGLTTVVLVAFLGHVAATLGFVATSWLWVGVFFSVLWGFTLNIMSTSTQALVQTAIDDSRRGRVMGLYTVIYRGTPAFGAIGTGVLAEFLGLQFTYAIAAIICLAAWIYLIPRKSEMERALERERV
ncbi:MAG: hypothetical protein RLZ98_899 [Pseudomonadota bacterium]|jgi:predicted MFS family arabinose efflux permease